MIVIFINKEKYLENVFDTIILFSVVRDDNREVIKLDILDF